MSGFSLDLYTAGIVSFEDFKALSEHPELNTHFEKIIGALTNKKAQPETKRVWFDIGNKKLSFA